MADLLGRKGDDLNEALYAWKQEIFDIELTREQEHKVQDAFYKFLEAYQKFIAAKYHGDN